MRIRFTLQLFEYRLELFVLRISHGNLSFQCLTRNYTSKRVFWRSSNGYLIGPKMPLVSMITLIPLDDIELHQSIRGSSAYILTGYSSAGNPFWISVFRICSPACLKMSLNFWSVLPQQLATYFRPAFKKGGKSHTS